MDRRLLIILALSLLIRIPGIDCPNGGYDEGVYALSASSGLVPHRDYFCSQPAHFIFALSLFSGSITSLRLYPLMCSLIGIAAAYVIGYEIAGRWAAAASSIALALAPHYLFYSNALEAEIPAAGLALAGLALANRAKDGRTAFAAGAIAAFAGFNKLPMLAAAAAVLYLLRQTHLRNAAALGCAVAAVPVFAVGVGAFVSDTLTYHLGSSSLGRFILVTALKRNPIFLVGLLFGLLPVLRSGRLGRALVFAYVPSYGYILLSESLFSHNLVLAEPLAAILFGVFIVKSLKSKESLLKILAALLVLGFAIQLAHSAIASLESTENGCGYGILYTQAVADVSGKSLATDEPLLAYVGGAKVPPCMFDTSHARLRRGWDPSECIMQSRPERVLLWTGRLRGSQDFMNYVNRNYELEKSYGLGRELYSII